MQGRVHFGNKQKDKKQKDTNKDRDEDEFEIGGINITSEKKTTAAATNKVVDTWGEAKDVPSLIGNTDKDKPAPETKSKSGKPSKFMNSKKKAQVNWNDTSKTVGKAKDTNKPVATWDNAPVNEWDKPTKKTETKKIFGTSHKISLINEAKDKKEEEERKARIKKKIRRVRGST